MSRSVPVETAEQLLAGFAVHYQVAHSVEKTRIVNVFQPDAETLRGFGAEAPRRKSHEYFPPTVGECVPAVAFQPAVGVPLQRRYFPHCQRRHTVATLGILRRRVPQFKPRVAMSGHGSFALTR